MEYLELVHVADVWSQALLTQAIVFELGSGVFHHLAQFAGLSVCDIMVSTQINNAAAYWLIIATSIGSVTSAMLYLF